MVWHSVLECATDNRPMRYFFLAAMLFGSLLLNGCSPTFNWRDVRPDQTPLVALFPCKPDQGERVVMLGAKEVTMKMLACDAGGVTFALAYANMGSPALTGVALAQWKAVTLGHLRAQSVIEQPFALKGAELSAPPVQVAARGAHPDGSAVAVQAVWFAAGPVVFQAAVYATVANPAAAEAYFAGLRLP